MSTKLNRTKVDKLLRNFIDKLSAGEVTTEQEKLGNTYKNSACILLHNYKMLWKNPERTFWPPQYL